MWALVLLLLYIQICSQTTNGNEMIASVRSETIFEVSLFPNTHNIQSQKNNTDKFNHNRNFVSASDRKDPFTIGILCQLVVEKIHCKVWQLYSVPKEILFFVQ